MKKAILYIFLLTATCITVLGQAKPNVIGSSVRQSATTPTGTCSPRGTVRLVGKIVYTCPESGTAVWTQINGDASPPQIVTGLAAVSNGGSAGSGNVRLGDISSTIAGEDGNYNAFPGLTRLPDGRLFVCYRVGTAHTTGGVLKYKISSDQGRTWSAATTIYTASGNEQVQDTEATLLRNGLIFVSWFNYDNVTTLSASKSMLGTIASDGTISWGSPRAITSDFTTETVASAKPVELPDGSLIIPVYGKGAGDTYYSTAAVKSTDQGATWGSHVTIASSPSSKQYNEAAIARLTNGTLVAIVRHETDLTGYDRSVSTDNGATWSSPTNVINLSGQLPGRPSLAVLGSGGLFMMYRSAPATTIAYATSWDNGVTWSSTSFGSQLFEYASVTLQSGGSIAVAYAVNTSGDVASNLTYQEFYDGYGLFGGGTSEAKKLRVAGTTELSGNLGIYQASPSTAIELGGTSARTIGMARNTGGFVGQSLTIKAGGGTEFISNRAGGDLIFESGQTTGNSAGANFIFRATTAGSSGITDNTYSTKAVIKGETGAGGFGAAPAVGNLLSAYGGASIGAPYGAVAAPTDGMIVYGLVGIRTNTPGYINSINYGTQLTVAGNGGFALTSAQPYWLMNETDQSADSRILDFILNSGVFSMRKFTDAGGSVVDLLKITRSSGEFEIPSKIKADASSTADETRLLLWDVSAGAFVRVSRGAADSCGSGFRCLRIPN